MTHDTSEAGAELRAKILDASVSPSALSMLLDGLPEPERKAAALGLSAAGQRALWRKVEGYRSLTLLDLVPATVPPLTGVRCYGRNSQPAFKSFEKRFFRAPDQDPSAPRELGGVNVSPVEPVAGPGYFVAVDDAARGEVCIDYTRVPSVAPDGWPKIVTNARAFRWLFYGDMIDTLRRVSEHVSIGSATKLGRDIGAYFVLCRQELP